MRVGQSICDIFSGEPSVKKIGVQIAEQGLSDLKESGSITTAQEIVVNKLKAAASS